jgi:hypothetical protein
MDTPKQPKSPYPAVSSCIHCIQLYPAIELDTLNTQSIFRIGCTLGVSIAIIWDDLALSKYCPKSLAEMCPHLKPFRECVPLCHTRALQRHEPSLWGLARVPTSPDSPVSTTGTSAAAWSVLSQHRPQHPDSALRALLLACRLDMRQARFRASRRGMK